MEIKGADMYSIILAGGSGSRLWPLSRDLYPKQLISLHGKYSLLQNTCKRLENITANAQNVLITNIKHANDVKFQLRQIQNNGIVLSEPMGKNTAPAIACALAYIKSISDKDEPVIILPSDHLIQDIKAFEDTVRTAVPSIEKGNIVTFGIKPSYPETGYGYIKTGEGNNNCYKVEKFVEKPDYDTAQQYLQEGCYYWNSGMFMHSIETPGSIPKV